MSRTLPFSTIPNVCSIALYLVTFGGPDRLFYFIDQIKRRTRYRRLIEESEKDFPLLFVVDDHAIVASFRVLPAESLMVR